MIVFNRCISTTRATKRVAIFLIFIIMPILTFNVASAVAAAHFPSPNITNTYNGKVCDFFGNFKIHGADAQPGDEVAFFDPQGNIAGVHVITRAGQYGIVAVYGDDDSTASVDEGAVSGDVLTVKIWDASSSQEFAGTALLLTPGASQSEFFISSTVPPVWQESAGYVLNIDTETHFPKPVMTPYVSNFMGSLTINGSPAEEGDEIAVLDPDGVLVGHFSVAAAGSFGIVSVYGDDPSTNPDEGAVDGDALSFKTWDKSAGEEYSGGVVSYAAGIPVGESSFVASVIPPVWTADVNYILDIAVTTHPSTLAITAGAGPGGTIYPFGTVTTNYGLSANFTITPNAGYHIADVRIDGIYSAGSVTSYTFANVVSNHTISALFSINTYTITVLAGENGKIEPAGPFVSTERGANAVFTITPGAGYRVQDVLADLISVGSVTSYAFTNVDADHTIEAIFASYAMPEFTLVFPVQDSVINTDMVEFTLSKHMTSGSVTYARTGGAVDESHTYTLQPADLAEGSHSIKIDLPLVNGAMYRVTFTVSDGVSAVSAIVNNVTYDAVSMMITNTRPAKKSIVTNATVSYALSEKAQTGRVTFTRTGGAPDSGSPRVKNLVGTELDSGSHTVDTGFSLANGAFYTVLFEAVDPAGNLATPVSNALVYFDGNYGKGPTGDVANEDGLNIVNDADVAKVKDSEGSRPGDPGWNPASDLDKNNVIDQKDLMILLQHYGR